MALSGSLTAGYWYSSNGQSRGYTLYWSATQSIENNQSTITWWVDTAGDYPYTVAERTLKVTLAGNPLIDKTDRVMRGPGRVADGKFTVTHASDGTYGFWGTIEAAVFGSSVNCRAETTFALNQIPRGATITNAPNFTDEENPTITYSNQLGNDVSVLEVAITWDGAGTNYIKYRDDISKTGTSYKFNLTDDERELLRKAAKNSNTLDVTYVIYTKYNGNDFWSHSYKKVTIVNAQPTLNPSVRDSNDATYNLTGSRDIFVRGFSNALVDSGSQVYKHATISSQYILNGNQRVNNGNDTINNVNSNSFIFSLTDSRGNTVTQTKTVPLIEYINPTCNLVVDVPDGDGDTRLVISGNYYCGSFGKVNNRMSLYYRHTSDSDEYSDWIEISEDDVDISSDNTYSIELSIRVPDYQKQYTFQARIEDCLTSVDSVERVVKATPIFDWGENDFNFNVPVTVLGTDILEKVNSLQTSDTIVEQGSSGVWIYRKWNSGLVEMWGKHRVTDLECSIGWGNMYETVSFDLPTYPFSISDAYGQVTWQNGNGAAFIEHFLPQPTHAGYTYLTRPQGAQVVALTGDISMYIMGRWK